MKKILPLGEDNFQNIINNNGYYVDKTKAIEEILDSRLGVKLFPRPRRFGKSLFMSMINNFFEIDRKEENKDLFKDLYISKSKYKDIQNTYPVINISFKELKQNTFESIVNQFRIMMSKIYSDKQYVLDVLNEGEKDTYLSIIKKESNIDELKNSVYFLSNCLYKYYNKKVIILIDEYDVPIQEGYLDNFYDEVISFIRTIMSSSLKTNEALAFGIITGVLRVSKESIFSDLNNLDIYSMYDNKYEEYFGFTETEANELLEYYDLSLTDEVKEMYDGYDLGNINMYNPWSILNYAKRKVLDTYWINTSGNTLIKDLLLKTNDENKNLIEKLIEGNYLEFTYNDKITYEDFSHFNDMDIIANILFSSGYLTIYKELEDGGILGKIPNLEVKKLLTTIIANLIVDNETSQFTKIRQFNRALKENNKEKIEKILNSMFLSLSFMDSQEYFYHSYALGIFKTLLDDSNYVVKSNREGGMGRFDVSIRKIDNTIGFILEFKLSDSLEDMEKDAEKAMNQMKEKEYYKELVLEKVEDIKELAIVFYDKKVIVR